MCKVSSDKRNSCHCPRIGHSKQVGSLSALVVSLISLCELWLGCCLSPLVHVFDVTDFTSLTVWTPTCSWAACKAAILLQKGLRSLAFTYEHDIDGNENFKWLQTWQQLYHHKLGTQFLRMSAFNLQFSIPICPSRPLGLCLQKLASDKFFVKSFISPGEWRTFGIHGSLHLEVFLSIAVRVTWSTWSFSNQKTCCQDAAARKLSKPVFCRNFFVSKLPC